MACGFKVIGNYILWLTLTVLIFYRNFIEIVCLQISYCRAYKCHRKGLPIFCGISKSGAVALHLYAIDGPTLERTVINGVIASAKIIIRSQWNRIHARGYCGKAGLVQ